MAGDAVRIRVPDVDRTFYPYVRVYNPDGSEAEMSGNGIRLFAKFALDRDIAAVDDGMLRIETGGGVRTLWPQMRGVKRMDLPRLS